MATVGLSGTKAHRPPPRGSQANGRAGGPERREGATPRLPVVGREALRGDPGEALTRDRAGETLQTGGAEEEEKDQDRRGDGVLPATMKKKDEDENESDNKIK